MEDTGNRSPDQATGDNVSTANVDVDQATGDNGSTANVDVDQATGDNVSTANVDVDQATGDSGSTANVDVDQATGDTGSTANVDVDGSQTLPRVSPSLTKGETPNPRTERRTLARVTFGTPLQAKRVFSRDDVHDIELSNLNLQPKLVFPTARPAPMARSKTSCPFLARMHPTIRPSFRTAFDVDRLHTEPTDYSDQFRRRLLAHMKTRDLKSGHPRNDMNISRPKWLRLREELTELPAQWTDSDRITLKAYHKVAGVVRRTHNFKIASRWRKVPHKLAIFKLVAKNLFEIASEKNSNILGKSYTDDQAVSDLFANWKLSKPVIGYKARSLLNTDPDTRTLYDVEIILNELQKFPTFCSYSYSAQQEIAKCGLLRRIDQNQTIIRQGQRSETWYFLLSGQGVTKEVNENTKDETFGFLSSGNSFGGNCDVYLPVEAIKASWRQVYLKLKHPTTNISYSKGPNGDLKRLSSTATPHDEAAATETEPKQLPSASALDVPAGKTKHQRKVSRAQPHEEDKSAKCLTSEKFLNVSQNARHSPTAEKDTAANSIEQEETSTIRQQPEKLVRIKSPDVHSGVTDIKKPEDSSNAPVEGHSEFTQPELQKRSSAWSRRKNYSIPKKCRPPRQPIEKKTDPFSCVYPPSFIIVDTLKTGDFFGLDQLKEKDWEKRPQSGKVSLVSNGAELIFISKSYFMAFSNNHTLAAIRNRMPIYPSSQEVQSQYRMMKSWQLHLDKCAATHEAELVREKKTFGVVLPDVRVMGHLLTTSL